jgi:predicted esterase
MVVLHGAGGNAADALRLLTGEAAERRLAVFAPQAVRPTWDLIGAGYGPDVVRIQEALDQVLLGCGVHTPLTIAGFSDGGSYALSLGLTNGVMFDSIVAFSPGFVGATSRTGRPSCFVSHGRADRVLPVQRCGRRIAEWLRQAEYRVRYHEFDGGHEVPTAIVEEAMAWLPDGRHDR